MHSNKVIQWKLAPLHRVEGGKNSVLLGGFRGPLTYRG